MFCKHKWKVLSETTTDSKLDRLMANIPEFAPLEMKIQWVKKKHIQIITCGKCGKLKRFVEEI